MSAKKEFTEEERSYFRVKNPGPGHSDVIGDLHRKHKHASTECPCGCGSPWMKEPSP